MILPGYICCIKSAGLTLHLVVQTRQYEKMHIQIIQLLEWGEVDLRWNLKNLSRGLNPTKPGLNLAPA